MIGVDIAETALRLQAELRQLYVRLQDQDRERQTRLERELNEARATIERVRAVLDRADISDRETGFYMDARDALDGPRTVANPNRTQVTE